MEGYYPARIIDTTDPRGGTWFAAWQHVKDGAEMGLVTLAGAPVPLPKSALVQVENDFHFAPGVSRDPALPVLVPFDQFVAEQLATPVTGG